MAAGKPMKESAKAKLRAQWTPERRREASEAAKKRASSSPPSGSSGDSSLPPSLPPTATRASAAESSRVESLLEKLMAMTEAKGKGTEATETKPALRELPDEDEERESALKPARFIARVPVIAFDETFRSFGLAELSPQERDEGANAFAVLFWQWGLYRDGRVMVALWLFAVLVPRVATALRKRFFEKKSPLALVHTAASPPTTPARSE